MNRACQAHDRTLTVSLDTAKDQLRHSGRLLVLVAALVVLGTRFGLQALRLGRTLVRHRAAACVANHTAARLMCTVCVATHTSARLMCTVL